jgi:hypothetical protein
MENVCPESQPPILLRMLRTIIFAFTAGFGEGRHLDLQYLGITTAKTSRLGCRRRRGLVTRKRGRHGQRGEQTISNGPKPQTLSSKFFPVVVV